MHGDAAGSGVFFGQRSTTWKAGHPKTTPDPFRPIPATKYLAGCLGTGPRDTCQSRKSFFHALSEEGGRPIDRSLPDPAAQSQWTLTAENELTKIAYGIAVENARPLTARRIVEEIQQNSNDWRGLVPADTSNRSSIHRSPCPNLSPHRNGTPAANAVIVTSYVYRRESISSRCHRESSHVGNLSGAS